MRLTGRAAHDPRRHVGDQTAHDDDDDGREDVGQVAKHLVDEQRRLREAKHGERVLDEVEGNPPEGNSGQDRRRVQFRPRRLERPSDAGAVGDLVEVDGAQPLDQDGSDDAGYDVADDQSDQGADDVVQVDDGLSPQLQERIARALYRCHPQNSFMAL